MKKLLSIMLMLCCLLPVTHIVKAEETESLSGALLSNQNIHYSTESCNQYLTLINAVNAYNGFNINDNDESGAYEMR